MKRGIPIILDATNLSERYREHLYSIADHLEVKLILVRVEAPPQLVRERLNAGWKIQRVSQMQIGEYTRGWGPQFKEISRNHYVMDTSRDITPVLDKIVREISHWKEI